MAWYVGRYCSSFASAFPNVVEANSRLNQALVEEPLRSCRLPPQLLPRVVCLKKALTVEFLDTAFKKLLHPGCNLRKRRGNCKVGSKFPWSGA